MPAAPQRSDMSDAFIPRAQEAVGVVEALLQDAMIAVRKRVAIEGGDTMARVFDREQRATHGLAWLATYVEALRQLVSYAERMQAEGKFGEIEDLQVRIGVGEYLAQILGGIPMSQGETVRLSDLGLSRADVASRMTPAVDHLIDNGNTAARRARLAEIINHHTEPTYGNAGLDETLEAIREEMRKFSASEVVPYAQGWHLKNQYIPIEVIGQMS
jgi:(2S)-methylsuccinyl-CoA dehydrogenase